MQHFEEVLARHERIALQFSGGKDSLVCLDMLREHLDKLTVYWLNTGDGFPESVALIEAAREHIPNFVEIDGRVNQVINEFGLPSDIVPATSNPFGRLFGDSQPLIQDRYSCCFRVVMQPLHERMIADGITLLIRGQKGADKLKGPLRSGDTQDGIEYLFPVENWTDEQVFDYLRDREIEAPPVYESMNTLPECMTCSGWWEDGRAEYLKRYHPKAYGIYQARLKVIGEACTEAIVNFNTEIREKP